MRTDPPPRPAILYDGHCVFCRAQLARLMRLVPDGALEPLSFQDDGVLARFPGITYDACMRRMQLVLADGRVFSGAAAAVRALALRGGLAKLAFIYYVPGIRQLADLAYALIARHRYRLMGRQVAAGDCADGTCSLHLKGKP